MMNIAINGRFTCTDCGHKYPATMREDQIPEKCICELKKEALKWINSTKDKLLDSNTKYGGVYVSILEDGIGIDNYESVIVDFDENNTAFEISVDKTMSEELIEYVNQGLKENGIGVYRSYSEFDEKISSYRKR